MKQRPQRVGILPEDNKDYFCKKHFKPTKYVFKNTTSSPQLLCQSCYYEFPEALLKHVSSIEEFLKETNVEDKKIHAQLERSLHNIKKAFDSLEISSQSLHKKLRNMLQTIHDQSFTSPDALQPKPKDKITSIGAYNFLRHLPASNNDIAANPRVVLSPQGFNEISDEICSTVTIQIDKLRLDLENMMARLDLPEKLGALSARDPSMSRLNYRKSYDAAPGRSSTPIMLGYSATRSNRTRIQQIKRNRSVDLPFINKSIELRLSQGLEDMSSQFVKVHSTPLKSVETVTHCPVTQLLVLGGHGKTDQTQNRVLVTMGKAGMSEVLKVVSAHTHQLNGVLARDGLLFSYSKDAFLKVWRSENLENILTIKHEGSVLSADYDPLGKRLFTCGRFGTVKVWNIEKNKEMHPVKLSDSIVTVKVKHISHRDWLAIGCGLSGKIYIFDLLDRLFVTQIVGHTSIFISLHYIEPSNTIVSVHADSCVKVWDISMVQKKKSLDALFTTKHNAMSVVCAAAIDDGKQTAFIVNSTKKVLRTDVQTGRLLNPIDLAGEDGIRVIAAVEVLSDLNTIAVGCKITGNVAIVVSA